MPTSEQLRSGDKRALARAITLIENGDPDGWELVREVYPEDRQGADRRLHRPAGRRQEHPDRRLTKEMRKADREVGVLSIDPSSPFTRGALLGDRIRLSDHFLDAGVFIRSMATRGALGGLSEAALQAALLMDASGKDDVLIETVGVGQAEIDIVDHADTIVLVLMPGSGDSIQALKAGVMEIPDVIVVNKADHPMTDTMVREIKSVLSLGPERLLAGAGLQTEAARGRASPSCRADRRAPRPHRGQGTLEERRARNLRNEVLGLAGREAAARARGARRRRPCRRRAARAGRPPRAGSGKRRERAAGKRPRWLSEGRLGAAPEARPQPRPKPSPRLRPKAGPRPRRRGG